MPTKKTTKKTTAKKVAKKAAPKKAVKKTTKKAVKKTATKKTAKKTSARGVKHDLKDMVIVDNDRAFWTTDGQVLVNLLALRDALTEMDREVYQYHAKPEQNDFALWVDSVLSDPECAADLSKAKTPKQAETVVVRHLRFYSL